MFISEFFTNESPIVNETSDMSDIITARELMGAAARNPQEEKHKYFEFLKHLRDHHGSEYSTMVHQQAARLAKVKEAN
jgi:pyruvate formate-lyase activating enzyme-like uncharacterized protein